MEKLFYTDFDNTKKDIIDIIVRYQFQFQFNFGENFSSKNYIQSL